MNLQHNILFCLILFFINHSIFSQNNDIDSLNIYFKGIDQLISETKPRDRSNQINTLLSEKETSYGIKKVNILHKLFLFNIYKNVQVANEYNQEALQLSYNLNYKHGIYKSRQNQAYILFIQGDFNSSMKSIQEILREISYRNYPHIYADLQTLKSDIHTEKGEYDLALETGLQLLDLAENTANSYLIMKAHAALSHYYLRLENYQKALEHCLNGLDYIIALKETHLLFQKVDEIARMSAKLGDVKGALNAYNYYLKLEKRLYSPGSYIQSIVYMNMADIYMNSGEYTNAKDYIELAMSLNNENNYRFRIPRALMIQAELYLKTQDTISAISAYEKSIEAAENINAFDVIKSNSLILMDLYKRANNTKKVFEYKSLHEAIRDSLFNNEKEQRIIILETRRKIKEVTQKQQKLELENLAQKNKYKGIIAIFCFVIIISLFVFYSYIEIKEKNKLLYRKTIENLRTQLKTEEKEITKKQTSTENREKTLLKMDDNVIDIILNKLEKLEQEKFFIDPNCNLHQLSDKLKTNPKYLSHVINIEKESNFNNYINDLRIDYLLTKLIKDKEFRDSKLSYIAASVGYNNLNTFNAAFKKRQGILPSYFIKQLNEDC
ncbi:helix-turn-helix domain-containing protein [Maribacter sp. CXY002]|uniref:helix-turn-helix domain-containing protein n=1 Tax=Maribacter luteocoastalis TaxID=3407671 RepID=UPI003B671E7B